MEQEKYPHMVCLKLTIFFSQILCYIIYRGIIYNSILYITLILLYLLYNYIELN